MSPPLSNFVRERLLVRALGAGLTLALLPLLGAALVWLFGRPVPLLLLACAPAAVGLALLSTALDLAACALRRSALSPAGRHVLAVGAGSLLGLAGLLALAAQVAYVETLGVTQSPSLALGAAWDLLAEVRAILAHQPPLALLTLTVPLGAPFALLCAAQLRELSPAGEAACALWGTVATALVCLPLAPEDYVFAPGSFVGAEIPAVCAVLLGGSLGLASIIGRRLGDRLRQPLDQALGAPV